MDKSESNTIYKLRNKIIKLIKKYGVVDEIKCYDEYIEAYKYIDYAYSEKYDRFYILGSVAVPTNDIDYLREENTLESYIRIYDGIKERIYREKNLIKSASERINDKCN